MLFSTPMVQAIISGKKTQTRRVIKLPSYHPSMEHKEVSKFEIKDFKVYDGNGDFEGDLKDMYRPGDILWVRECFHKYESADGSIIYSYKVENKIIENAKIWKPSIHMPKEACRLFLQIKSIKCERLHDISESDAIAEGVNLNKKDYQLFLQTLKNDVSVPKHIAGIAFMDLWGSINGKESWDANPWVWVIEFEQIEKPAGFLPQICYKSDKPCVHDCTGLCKESC